MVRTQIYLPEELHRDLLAIAQAERVTMAELVRESAKELVAKKKQLKKKKFVFNPPSFKGGLDLKGPLTREMIYERL